MGLVLICVLGMPLGGKKYLVRREKFVWEREKFLAKEGKILLGSIYAITTASLPIAPPLRPV